MRATLMCLGLLGCLLLQGCQKPDQSCGCVAPPLASQLMGKWEWIKTVTPTRTITPQTVGYSSVFQHENDGSDYIAFYKNDSLSLRLVQSRNFYQEDREQLTILEQFGSMYLKYYLVKGSDYASRELQTSELLSPYAEKADTVRHYYRFKGR